MTKGTVNYGLLGMGLQSCRQVRLLWVQTNVHSQMFLQSACKHENWTKEQWKNIA